MTGIIHLLLCQSTNLFIEHLHLSLCPGDERPHHKLMHKDPQPVLITRGEALTMSFGLTFILTPTVPTHGTSAVSWGESSKQGVLCSLNKLESNAVSN